MNNGGTSAGLTSKIARLVRQRGWNQEECARIAGVSRLTVRGILQATPRRLHNATLAKFARALDLTVNDLCELPLETLLARPHKSGTDDQQSEPKKHARAYEEATQPELLAWAQDHGQRAGKLSPAEWDELLSLQGTGGPLTADGVEKFVDLIERKRILQEKIAAIAGTEQIDLLEQFVELLYEKIQPYRNRK